MEADHHEPVTVKRTESLVPWEFVTERSYVPGVINADAIAQGGVTFRHGGLVAVGTGNRMEVLLEAATFA